MTLNDPKYITERFLAAFDEVQAETGASDLMMSLAVDNASRIDMAVKIRQSMAAHMSRPDIHGRRGVHRGRIADALGVRRNQVNKYLAAAKVSGGAA